MRSMLTVSITTQLLHRNNVGHSDKYHHSHQLRWSLHGHGQVTCQNTPRNDVETNRGFANLVYYPTERQVAERSILIKNMLEDLGDSGEAIPIPNVNESVLKKVVEWCEHHKNDPPSTGDEDSDSRRKTTDIDEWDQKFMQVDQEMLFEIILAANYLDIKALLDVGCKTVANMIKGKSPDEIRKTFNIQNDFTPEEEDQIRRENEWAEE
ncbi:hypothetical protein LOZ61_001744 [Ophidiomyces ophidiicola]|nr:hypothetical protein LOZ61_001744 [Ophidiomyces ophidiicola]KAI2010385.1 hypothetical protein LOZ49_003501 [Ophidiomyces ophidiicola]KAI2149017.1 hypothetical protein LOZ27_001154 [Ophidiomyces ophidiicola]KAI2237876.1 hypothetical protein LOZ13_004104 [Ophidiomyces ophidiicola]KAI2267204.1 hypothetical protein LOZ10_001537 [Ophidiomyces ophidiicola]